VVLADLAYRCRALSRAAELVLLAGALAGCHHPRAVPAADPPRGAAMLGTWEYQAQPPKRDAPSLNMGLQVALEIHSAVGDRFRGRVTLWLAGDAGGDVSAFGPVEGTVSATAQVAFTIPYARGGAAPMTVAGTLAGDTLMITEARPFSAGARFVRTKRPTSSR
jgi:hypothetical protein